MPPTYLFGLPHIHEKKHWGLSDAALKVLRMTSLGFVCSGLYLLTMSSTLWLNSPSPSSNVRGSSSASAPDAFFKLRPTIVIESLASVGAWSIAVGITSSLNYIFYTGIPNIFSFLDFVCVVWGAIHFCLRNHALIAAGHGSMIFMHAWCGLTLCTYVCRKKPHDQIWVHAMGQCGLVLWYLLLNAKYIFSY